MAAVFTLQAQQHSLAKIWETDTTIAVPESVLPDLKKGILYVSLIDGKGWDDDGKGGIGIMDINGKSFNNDWITGLSAPKGMGIIGNKLYVADITRVVVIDLNKGKIITTIRIATAENLNDITIGNGVVFVSDSKAGRIWQIKNDKPSLYLDNEPSTNGLKFFNNELYFGQGKNFKKVDNKKKITTVAELPQGIDGIEPVGNGDFIVTAWVGYIFYVKKDGSYQTLLETHQQQKNTADIGYDAQKKIVYVPTFNGKTIAAYQLH